MGRMTPNKGMNRSAQRRCRWFPVALRAPTLGYARRWASDWMSIRAFPSTVTPIVFWHLRTLAVLAACALTPLASVAQTTLPRIGVLWPGDIERYGNAFLEALRKEGYTAGVSARIDIRSTNGNFASGLTLAEELVALSPDVIFAVPGPLAKHVVRAVDKAGRKIPIVVYADDPVEEGLVVSAARPGGNVTGLGDVQEPEFVTKLLQVLKEVVPGLSRVLYLEDPTWGAGGFRAVQSRQAMERGGRQLGVQVSTVEIRTAGDIERAFPEAVRQRVDGIIVAASVVVITHRDRIIQLAAKHRLPAVYGDELFAYDGGLISYWTSIAEMNARAAGYVARILRGAKPGDLPVEYPTEFRLVVNLRTAKALGIAVPAAVLVQADEVIK
jgi:putative tryptophan/tyrosine transport system substrate-binding protein